MCNHHLVVAAAVFKDVNNLHAYMCYCLSGCVGYSLHVSGDYTAD